ncbi:MAG: UpxY family transcription antiterminator [Bacteroidales bacterium]|nr:UpxY family transcription antiterminator [Bacteroidales bacterium]
MIDKKTKKWYAVYVRSRAEKKVAAEMEENNIEAYLPLFKTIRQWSDRKKRVHLPLIRGYLFVHIKGREYFEVLKIQGVVSFVKFLGKPTSIPAWQIQNLKILLGSGEEFEFASPDLGEGDFVHITAGVLKGLKGRIVKVRQKKKLLISLDALDYSFTVDIHPALVERIRVPRTS